jgi:competence protein ComEC
MPLLWLSLAFLAGILLADTLPLATSTWLILVGVSLLLTVLRWIVIRKGQQRLNLQRFTFNLSLPIPILLLFLCFGGARYQSKIPDLSDPGFIAAYNDLNRQMVVTGMVESMPDVRDSYTYLRVEAERFHPAGELDYIYAKGLILVRVSPGKAYHYGDRVLMRGYLEIPPEAEAFSYREYLARQGIYTTMNWARVTVLEVGKGNWFMAQMYSLKEVALDLVYRLWPDPEASLFSGILLGVETGIPEPVQEAFKETGTSHIIAISGFNIAIISGLFARSFGRILGLYRGAIAALVAISIYTILVGADAAVVRAAIMGGLSLLASLVGRRQYGPLALALTAAGMAFKDPHVLWDVGYQLSFAATLGLVLYADPLQGAFARFISRWTSEDRAKSLAGPVGEFILFTFAAQVTTLPIMAYHFGTVSWVALLANPVILPVQPPIMILGGLALLLGLVWYPLGKLFAVAGWPFVLFTIRAVEFFGRRTQGSFNLGEFSLLWLVLYYAVLLAVTFGWTHIQNWVGDQLGKLDPGDKQRRLVITALLVTGILALVTWRAAFSSPDGLLHLTLLEVGTGDAVLLQTPEGGYILINGGPSTRQLSDGLGRRLPPFHRQIDWLVLASPRGEQIASLPRLVERFTPENVLWAGLQSPSREADYLRESLTSLQVPVTEAQIGHRLDLGQGAFLQILTSGSRGAILLLEWNRFRALLPLGISDGDMESTRMGLDIGQVNALVLADNGYAPSNPPGWITNLNPQLTLLSVAPDDRDGLPDRQTLEALRGYTLLRTDQNGWIEVLTDGEQMWVEVERK